MDKEQVMKDLDEYYEQREPISKKLYDAERERNRINYMLQGGEDAQLSRKKMRELYKHKDELDDKIVNYIAQLEPIDKPFEEKYGVRERGVLTVKGLFKLILKLAE